MSTAPEAPEKTGGAAMCWCDLADGPFCGTQRAGRYSWTVPAEWLDGSNQPLEVLTHRSNNCSRRQWVNLLGSRFSVKPDRLNHLAKHFQQSLVQPDRSFETLVVPYLATHVPRVELVMTSLAFRDPAGEPKPWDDNPILLHGVDERFRYLAPTFGRYGLAIARTCDAGTACSPFDRGSGCRGARPDGHWVASIYGFTGGKIKGARLLIADINRLPKGSPQRRAFLQERFVAAADVSGAPDPLEAAVRLFHRIASEQCRSQNEAPPDPLL